MADVMFNQSLGRGIEFQERVNDNDPANSALVLVLLQAVESDALLRDRDTLDAVLTEAANTEATFTNYARIVLADADLAATTVDDGNDRREADFADQTWSLAGGAVNNSLDKLLICFDSDTTGGTDANIIPIAAYDFVITTNGGDVIAQLNASGWLRAA